MTLESSLTGSSPPTVALSAAIPQPSSSRPTTPSRTLSTSGSDSETTSDASPEGAPTSTGSPATSSSTQSELWTSALPRYVRRYGRGQRRVRVKNRVDRDLEQLAEVCWLALADLGADTPTPERRRRRR